MGGQLLRTKTVVPIYRTVDYILEVNNSQKTLGVIE